MCAQSARWQSVFTFCLLICAAFVAVRYLVSATAPCSALSSSLTTLSFSMWRKIMISAQWALTIIAPLATTAIAQSALSCSPSLASQVHYIQINGSCQHWQKYKSHLKTFHRFVLNKFKKQCMALYVSLWNDNIWSAITDKTKNIVVIVNDYYKLAIPFLRRLKLFHII